MYLPRKLMYYVTFSSLFVVFSFYTKQSFPVLFLFVSVLRWWFLFCFVLLVFFGFFGELGFELRAVTCKAGALVKHTCAKF
jgi:hypothetical protein